MRAELRALVEQRQATDGDSTDAESCRGRARDVLEWGLRWITEGRPDRAAKARVPCERRPRSPPSAGRAPARGRRACPRGIARAPCAPRAPAADGPVGRIEHRRRGSRSPTSAATKTSPTTSQSIDGGIDGRNTADVARGSSPVWPVLAAGPSSSPSPGRSFRRGPRARRGRTSRKKTSRARCRATCAASARRRSASDRSSTARRRGAPRPRRRRARRAASRRRIGRRSLPAPAVAGPRGRSCERRRRRAEDEHGEHGAEQRAAEVEPGVPVGGRGHVVSIRRRHTEDLCAAFGSDENSARSTSPRSSPSTWRGSGRSDAAARSRPRREGRGRPASSASGRVSAAATRRGIASGPTARGATTSSPASHLASGVGRTRQPRPGTVYGSPFATSAKRRPSVAVHLDLGGQPSAPFGEEPARRSSGTHGPGAVARPRARAASTRRTTSAGNPNAAANPKRRPFTRPSEISARPTGANRIGDPPRGALGIAPAGRARAAERWSRRRGRGRAGARPEGRSAPR